MRKNMRLAERIGNLDAQAAFGFQLPFDEAALNFVDFFEHRAAPLV